MKFKCLKNIDKVMYVISMILATVTILVISYFILLSVMSLFNKMEYYTILKDMNVYREFYNTLNIVNSMALPILFFGFIGTIPYLILSGAVFIFFTIRYVKNKEKNISKFIFIGILLIFSIFVIIKGVTIYPITGRYDLYINSEISKIVNNEVKEFVTEQMKEYDGKNLSNRTLKKDYYIYKIEIKGSFPNYYDGIVFYRDIINKEKKIFISSDSNVIMKYAKNRTNELSIKATLLFITGEATYIIFIMLSQKEIKRISNYKENTDLEETKNKGKVKKIIIIGIISTFLIICVLSIIIMQIYPKEEMKTNKDSINYLYSENKNNSFTGYGSSSETQPLGILYETKINGNTIIRVVNLSSILGQKTVIGIEKSTDNGKKFIKMYKEGISIHDGAEICFINENIGFINDFGLAGTNGDNKFFRVTTDGGRSFECANIIHPESIEEKTLFVKGVPYVENNKLKLQIYTINYAKNPERTYYTFYSEDNGLNWKIEE